MQKILEKILVYSKRGAILREEFFEQKQDKIYTLGLKMAQCLAKGEKILICGNGGSAADAQHFAAELVNRFEIERYPLAALALTTDTSILTAIGNDYHFNQIFAKQVEALGKPGDILVAISTSGNSENIILAINKAREKNLLTIGLTGKGGGKIAHQCDFFIEVLDQTTCLIQEIHIALIHIWCYLIEDYLFKNSKS